MVQFSMAFPIASFMHVEGDGGGGGLGYYDPFVA